MAFVYYACEKVFQGLKCWVTDRLYTFHAVCMYNLARYIYISSLELFVWKCHNSDIKHNPHAAPLRKAKS